MSASFLSSLAGIDSLGVVTIESFIRANHRGFVLVVGNLTIPHRRETVTLFGFWSFELVLSRFGVYEIRQENSVKQKDHQPYVCVAN